ncbi:hypothetical protein TUMEXPCC7403_12835 [Tumidithrix helvetica PCC 7403]|uniref:hypothetical protein n=1 Tax=Tumidithrix helvetica TaxID=3457545 RepID=UPI003CC1994B
MNSNQDMVEVEADRNDANRDPISGEPGAHPLGTGVGAAGAGTIATVVGGVVGGPVGAVVGALVGSVIGGLAGKETAEGVNPTFEDNHWRENYATRPYADPTLQYEDYQPGYRIGYEGYAHYAHTGRSYNDLEPELRRDYENTHGDTRIHWEKAKHAVRDAWEQAATSAKK